MINKFYFQTLCLTLASLLLAMQTFVVLAAVPLDRIVAVVEDGIIMQSELNMHIKIATQQMKKQDINLPSQEILEKQVLERMILTKIQLQLAQRTGINIDDETLNNTIANIARENQVSLSEFIDILEKDGLSYTRFRENIRNEITILRLRQRQVDNRISITTKELENALLNESNQGNTQTEYNLQHILFSLAENPTLEQKEKVRSIAMQTLESLQDGEDFTTMAASVSDGLKALEGGYLGWRKHNEIPTLFSHIISTMKENDISELIENSSGLHIIKLAGVRNNTQHMITQTKARHILVHLDDLTTKKDAKHRLEQLKARIKNGDAFDKLAKAHSDDMLSAVKGGSLGWVSSGQLVPEFENIMNTLELGEISAPFATNFGWHIVQVEERREHDDTENTRQKKVSEAIRTRKSEEVYQNWLRHIRDEAYVEYR